MKNWTYSSVAGRREHCGRGVLKYAETFDSVNQVLISKA